MKIDFDRVLQGPVVHVIDNNRYYLYTESMIDKCSYIYKNSKFNTDISNKLCEFYIKLIHNALSNIIKIDRLNYNVYKWFKYKVYNFLNELDKLLNYEYGNSFIFSMGEMLLELDSILNRTANILVNWYMEEYEKLNNEDKDKMHKSSKTEDFDDNINGFNVLNYVDEEYFKSSLKEFKEYLDSIDENLRNFIDYGF